MGWRGLRLVESENVCVQISYVHGYGVSKSMERKKIPKQMEVIHILV